MTRTALPEPFRPRPAPFGTIRKVPPFEASRWPARRERANPRAWTHEQTDALATLLANGLSYDEIARRLGRTPTAVRVRCWRLGWTMQQHPTVLTASEAARLLGASAYAIVTWIARGWLPARRRRSGPHTYWAIQYDALRAMLANDATWMAWQPERVPDPALRAELLALRAGQPAWLTVGEVARRCHVTTRAVYAWIMRGQLPATRYGNHYVRESDLVGWVVPGDRPRARRVAA